MIKLYKNVKIVKTFQNGQTLSKQVKEFQTNQKCTKILTKNVKIVKKISGYVFASL